MCAVIAWNLEISGHCHFPASLLICTGQFDLCLLEITHIQHNAVFFSQRGGEAYKHLFDKDAHLRSKVKYPRK